MPQSTLICHLCDDLDSLRRKLIELEGDDPNYCKDYKLFAPADPVDIQKAETDMPIKYPSSYRTFLELHNGWHGFWPDWSLVGIPRKDNRFMHREIKDTFKLIPVVADNEARQQLVLREKSDPKVILPTNHLVMGIDFNGSLLLFDSNRVADDGEAEIAWVHYGAHVERRWKNFVDLLKDAIADTKRDIVDMTQ
jgi:hypothetical protein